MIERLEATNLARPIDETLTGKRIRSVQRENRQFKEASDG